MSELKVLSYNILDVELESNFVPRTMHPSCINAINNSSPNERFISEKTPIQIITDAYLQFHKGFNGISKSDTRKLWAKEDTTGDETKPYRNLKQNLIDIFDNEKANELYNLIKSINYSWVENRLDRVYEKIIKDNPDIICLQEYGNCKDLTNTTQSGGTTFPNNETRDSRQIIEGSLSDKLTFKGYTYQLFSYNPEKKDGDDGVAIFYKGNVFDSSIVKIYIDMDKENQDNYNIYTTQRGCGLLELTLRDTNQKVVICTTHIQTSSNEKVPGDKYAIRRGELQFIKDHINSKYGSTNDMVIFCGDLNLDLNTEKDKEIIDAFEADNILKRIKFKHDNDDLGLVTSYPSGRQEYIDYFFTNCEGKLTGEYKVKSELNGEIIPNGSDQPSDHIPILLTVTIPSKSSGGKSRKKQRKPKRKTQRKKQRKTKRKINKSKNKSKK